MPVFMAISGINAINYNRGYSPLTFTVRGAENVDWVNEKAKVSLLGF